MFKDVQKILYLIDSFASIIAINLKYSMNKKQFLLKFIGLVDF